VSQWGTRRNAERPQAEERESMSVYQWVDVLFREKDRSTRFVPGIVIGYYTVSPALMDDCPYDQFSAAIWRVSHAGQGIAIVEYTDFKVAVAFARFLSRHYGSLSDLAQRYVNQIPLTDEDNRILDEIDTKRRHVSQHTGNYVEYIPFKPEDF
jgi:hypothetical protein